MSRPTLRRWVLLPLLAAAISQLACPTVTIKSLEVLRKVKTVVTLGATVEVDNGEAYADAVTSTFVVGVPEGWVVQDVRYRIPGEPLQRRAQPAPGIAAQADWTYVQPGAIWYGFQTVEHVIPTGLATYTAEIDVNVGRKIRGGPVVLVVGEPGAETPIRTYRLMMRPKPTLNDVGSPEINPEAILEEPLDAGGDMGWMFGEGGEDLESLGEGLGELGDGLGMLGSLLGAAGEPGYREEWMVGQTTDGRLQLPGVSLAFPADVSVMGEPPTGERVQLVLFPPGAAYLGGVDVQFAVDEATANQMYDQEVQTAVDDLAISGQAPAVEEIPVFGASGARIRTTMIEHSEGGQVIRTTLMARIEHGMMILGASFGDTGAGAGTGGSDVVIGILDSAIYE